MRVAESLTWNDKRPSSALAVEGPADEDAFFAATAMLQDAFSGYRMSCQMEHRGRVRTEDTEGLWGTEGHRQAAGRWWLILPLAASRSPSVSTNAFASYSTCWSTSVDSVCAESSQQDPVGLACVLDSVWAVQLNR